MEVRPARIVTRAVGVILDTEFRVTADRPPEIRSFSTKKREVSRHLVKTQKAWKKMRKVWLEFEPNHRHPISLTRPD